MSKAVDKTGMRFGRLVVLGRSNAAYPPVWRCRCDCGNEVMVIGNSLGVRGTKSCGCLKKDNARARAAEHITHGQTKTRLYRIWFNMKCRCHKETAPDFHRYGGRGITVCDEWRNGFQPFYDWAMANGYRDDLSIDRIDSNGNYCPENCRWEDSKTQNNNTRRNHYVTYNGETLTISQWAERCGISRNTLHSRITKYGWSVERALTEGTEAEKSEIY